MVTGTANKKYPIDTFDFSNATIASVPLLLDPSDSRLHQQTKQAEVIKVRYNCWQA
jgi:hypothetical protein